MQIDEDFEGYKQWREGTKQTVIGDPGDTKQDVIKFMHAHLDRFGISEQFTFDASRIQQNGNEFIVTIHKFGADPKLSRFRINGPLEQHSDDV